MTEKLGVLVDSSALKDMFEGGNTKENSSYKLMQKMKENHELELPMNIITPMSHFLRAIFLSDPKTPIENIQKVLSFIDVRPSFADFKDKDDCMNEIISIAKILGRKPDNENH